MTCLEAANKIYGKLPRDYPTLDPAIIGVILELLKVLLPIIIENCQETPEAVPKILSDMRHPRDIRDRIRRWRLEMTIRRELGWMLYRDLQGPALADAICQAGAESTPEEIWALCDSL